jgi:hypothetical protein
MTPWFIATERFIPDDGIRWDNYVKWSGLDHLKEVVSLDPLLCPSVLPEIKNHYWPHIVNEDFMLDFFLDYDFLKNELADVPRKNVLCVFRNPSQQPVAPPIGDFEFLGYDLVDVHNGARALTNCGGFPDVYANSELSEVALLPDFKRAFEVQESLRSKHPEEFHANCHRWAVFRAKK